MTKHKQTELLKALKSYTKSVNTSKVSARKALIDEGIYLETGELAPEYKEATAA